MSETMNDMEFCNSADRYNVSKLLQVMFMREPAARLPSPTFVVECTIPGFCRSNLFWELDGKWYGSFVSLASALSSTRTPEQGSSMRLLVMTSLRCMDDTC
ncbi:hypothetical protein BKA83DRAFT_687442 [Pisolithus microcarpus]|nr:hypothetical protein BKA83DRAFT_687442 [Pisolithus microcarpus]